MTLKDLPIDIVIPVHKKDLQILEYCIDAAKKKIINARRIIVISKERYSDNAEWFDEKLFPFSFELVHEYVGGSTGWYFQQLLKLYAPLIIPDISENVMILDSDTVLFRRVRMLDEEGRSFYNISKDTNVRRKDFDQRVAAHTKTMLPALATENLPSEFQEISGISHNMVFNREILRDLFDKVEEHDGSGDPFYKIFLKHSNAEHSASEYQIYFNFLLIFYRDKIRIRKLCYKNTADINIRKYRRRFKYHYCSFHSYLRGTRTNSMRVRIEELLRKISEKLFYIEVWNIGIVRKNIADFLNFPNQKIEWLSRPKFLTFRADPFGVIGKNGEKNILFESYNYWLRKGKISRVKLDENLKIIYEREILNREKHLSYPYIFSDGNQKFALVESYKTKKLTLYKVNEDASLEEIKDLFEGLEIVDPSITKHDGKWWIFFTLNDCGNDKLHLAFSENLTGEWKMHPQNPVKVDMASSRSAGEIFSVDGVLFRPSQNCTKTYGGSIIINRISVLSEEKFEEKEEIEIFPNQLGLYPDGLHNISTLGENLTLLDGKKKVFAPYKPLVSLVRNLLKIFRKFFL
jgi:hypothetical protein